MGTVSEYYPSHLKGRETHQPSHYRNPSFHNQSSTLGLSPKRVNRTGEPEDGIGTLRGGLIGDGEVRPEVFLYKPRLDLGRP